MLTERAKITVRRIWDNALVDLPDDEPQNIVRAIIDAWDDNQALSDADREDGALYLQQISGVTL